MEKIFNFLTKIPKDKLLHFFLGSLISFPLILLFGFYGFLISIIIFAGKEIIWDKIFKKGTPEIMDFIYSIIPAIMFIIIKLCFISLF
jgi:hypothetical protein